MTLKYHWLKIAFHITFLSLAVHVALAGTYLGDNPLIVTHPLGYTGAGGEIVVRVCVEAYSFPLQVPTQNAMASETKFERNNHRRRSWFPNGHIHRGQTEMPAPHRRKNFT